VIYDNELRSLQLRELGPEDESAFLSWYESWKNDDPEWATFIWKPGMSHAEHLKRLSDYNDSRKIPPHHVTSTMLYAFVRGEIVGRISVRHKLNENLEKRGGHVGYSVGPSHRRKGYAKEMFKQAMHYCETLELTRILVSCADSNEASWRVIECFGGSLENRVFDNEEDEMIRRYWVDVKEALTPTIEVKDKVVGYVIRQKGLKTELLVFDHDKEHSEAGTQVPAGTVDKDENFESALFREIYEEAGVSDLIIKGKVDQYSFYREIQNCHNRRHVYCVNSLRELPDTWTHQVTGDGVDKQLNFHYYWIDLETAKTKLSARLGYSIEHLKKYLQQGEDNESN
jgi:predicted acetyltransferase/8-oxo-dGTP pyrophosphatase MutT (NUDIX family)